MNVNPFWNWRGTSTKVHRHLLAIQYFGMVLTWKILKTKSTIRPPPNAVHLFMNLGLICPDVGWHIVVLESGYLLCPPQEKEGRTMRSECPPKPWMPFYFWGNRYLDWQVSPRGTIDELQNAYLEVMKMFCDMFFSHQNYEIGEGRFWNRWILLRNSFFGVPH